MKYKEAIYSFLSPVYLSKQANCPIIRLWLGKFAYFSKAKQNVVTVTALYWEDDLGYVCVCNVNNNA